MTIELSSSIGYFAAFLTTVAFIPQAYQSWKTRDISCISLPMYTLFTSGVTLWLVYGFYIDSMPIVIANAITLVLSTIVLTLKSIEVFSKK
jgi:MtN3 and saliva related transmembrane protein